MALTFDLSKVENYETVCLTEERKIKPITNNLLMLTLTVKMGKITEGNYKEFYYRLDFANRLFDLRLSITLDDVKSHIGMTTNVSTENWSKFVSNTVKGWCVENRFKPASAKALV